MPSRMGISISKNTKENECESLSSFSRAFYPWHASITTKFILCKMLFKIIRLNALSSTISTLLTEPPITSLEFEFLCTVNEGGSLKFF